MLPLPLSASAVLIAMLLASAALAQPRLELLTEAVPEPIYVTHAGDARLFIAERAGRVWIYENGGLLPTPYLDLSDQVDSQGDGAFGSIAFHPAYAQNGRSFVHYTAAGEGGGLVLVVARLEVSAGDPNRVDPASHRELLRLPKSSTTHNGGQLQFGPDGFLYISIGDAGGDLDPSCNAQNRDQLFGKLLRIDVDLENDVAPWYEIPPGNPFAAPDDGAADEIWALGLRNPFRFSFDRSSGGLWLGDVGEAAREEVDLEPAGSPGGRNYGWKVLEGTLCLLPGQPVGGSCPAETPPCDDPGYVAPAFEYEHPADEFAAITGGVVYRGTESPAFQGRYVFADSFLGDIWALRETTPPYSAELLLADEVVAPVAIGENRAGELYVADLFPNRVYRLRLGSAPGTPDVACIVATNLASAKLARAAARDVRACTLAASDMLGGASIEACIAEDRKGAVAKRVAKLDKSVAARCSGERRMGFGGGAAAAGAAVASERRLAHAVFGPDLGEALDATASDTLRCQRAAQQALNVCQSRRRTEFLHCKRAGLRDGSIASLAELAACLDADPKGRIARACAGASSKLAEVVSGRCVEAGVDPERAFPGCASDLGADAGACLDRAGRCAHCRHLDAADGLGVNCDLYDDGAANVSCKPLELE
jgi:glucose/arabinose dehydrogenase